MIKYVVGDATKPESSGSKIIVHVCNNQGGWGSGFVVAVSKRWRKPEEAYRQWYASKLNFELGQVQYVAVEQEFYQFPGLWVANMVAQNGYQSPDNPCPLDYEALRECLWDVSEFADYHELSVHMPRIGCGLAGGQWPMVEQIIYETLLESAIPTTVYDLP